MSARSHSLTDLPLCVKAGSPAAYQAAVRERDWPRVPVPITLPTRRSVGSRLLRHGASVI